MGKFDDATREGLQSRFLHGEVPDEEDFAAWIQAIQDGIEWHEHVPGGGPGSGTGDAAPVTPDLGADDIVPDTVVDNLDTWRKLLASRPYIAREAAPLMWEGTNRQGQTWSITTDDEFVYVGLLGHPAMVVKIDPSTMETVNSWTGEEGQGHCRALLFDGTYLYAALYTSPAQVVKINPSAMATVNSWTGEDGQDNCQALTFDGFYLYAGLDTDPASAVQINANTMVATDVWETAPGWQGCTSLTWDGLFLYAGLDTDPAKVVKIDTGNMETVEVWVGDAAMRYVRALAFDGSFVYAGLYTTAAQVVKINPATMLTWDIWLGASGVDNCCTLTFDGEYIYAGTYCYLSKVIQIETEFMTTRCIWAGMKAIERCIALTFDGLYIFAALKTYPARVVRFIMHEAEIELAIWLAAMTEDISVFFGKLREDGSIDWVLLLAGWPDGRYRDNCVALVWDGDALILAIGKLGPKGPEGPAGLWKRSQPYATPSYPDEEGGWEEITTLPDPVNDAGDVPAPVSSELLSCSLRRVGDTFYFTRYKHDTKRAWLYTSPDLSSWQSFQVHQDPFEYHFLPVERQGLVVLPGGHVLILGHFVRAGSMRIPSGVGATVPYGSGMHFECPFSIRAWCRPDDWGINNVILRRAGVFELGMTGGDNDVYLKVWNKDGSISHCGPIGGGFNAPAGQWSYHRFTVDGSNVEQVCRNYYLWWDSYNYSVHPVDPAVGTSSLELWVGAGGYLDYSAAGSCGYGFDELSGDTVYDEGPNGLHGTLVNGQLGFGRAYTGYSPSYCGGTRKAAILKWGPETGLFTRVKLWVGLDQRDYYPYEDLVGLTRDADGSLYAFGRLPPEGNVVMSPGDGVTWLPWGSFLGSDDFVATLLPMSDGSLYAFSYEGQVWHLPAGGEWARKTDLPQSRPVCSLEIITAEMTYIFVGVDRSNSIYSLVGSIDGAQTWSPYSDDFPHGWKDEIWDLCLCPP